MLLREDSVDAALNMLGRVLEERALAFEIVVIGGSALLLLDISTRPTRDLDVVAVVREGQYVLAAPLPDGIRTAAVDVAGTLDLSSNWLNEGPTGLLDTGLPPGFEQRVATVLFAALVGVQVLCRGREARDWLPRWPRPLLGAMLGIMLLLIVLSPGDNHAFIYFQF